MKLFGRSRSAAHAVESQAEPETTFEFIDRARLLQLLQQLAGERHTGALTLRTPDGAGWLYGFQQGSLVHAEGGRARGARQAFDLLLEFESGHFVFQPLAELDMPNNLYIPQARLLELSQRSQQALQSPMSPFGGPPLPGPTPWPHPQAMPAQQPAAPASGMAPPAQPMPHPASGLPPPPWARPGLPTPPQPPAVPAAPLGPPAPPAASPWPAEPGQAAWPPAAGSGGHPLPAADAGAMGSAPPSTARPHDRRPAGAAPPSWYQGPPPAAPPPVPTPPPPAPPRSAPAPNQFGPPPPPPAAARPPAAVPPLQASPPSAPPSPHPPVSPLPPQPGPAAAPPPRVVGYVPTVRAPAAPRYEPPPSPALSSTPKAAPPADDVNTLRRALTVPPSFPGAPAPLGGDARAASRGKARLPKAPGRLSRALRASTIRFLVWAAEQPYSPDDEWTLKEALDVAKRELRTQMTGLMKQYARPSAPRRRPAQMDANVDQIAAGRMASRRPTPRRKK